MKRNASTKAILIASISLLGNFGLTSCHASQNQTSTSIDYTVGHTLSTLIPEEEPTCTENGCKAYYYCLDCYQYFDVDKKPTTLEDLVIPAKGHDFGDDYICKNCGLDLSEIVTAINDLPNADTITINSLADISSVVSKYDALDESAKKEVDKLIKDPEKLKTLSNQVSGIVLGVSAKYLYNAGQNQNLTPSDTTWEMGKDDIYGNYKEIKYDTWEWANIKYASSTLPQTRTCVLFVYNACDKEVNLTWGHVDPANAGCIYHAPSEKYCPGAEENHGTGHQILKASSWNVVKIAWNQVYGFSGNIFCVGPYAGDGTSMSGWKYSDVYMMEESKVATMDKIIENSIAAIQ